MDLGVLDECVTGLAGVEVHAATPGLGDELVALAALMSRLEREVCRRAAALSHSDEWMADGSTSPVTWLAHHARLGRRDAARAVATGRALASMPTVDAAWADGSLPAASVHHLARAQAASPEGFAGIETDLVEVAAGLRVDQVALVCRRLRDSLDHVAADARAVHWHNQRSVRLGATLDGTMTGEMFLDAADGAIVLRALNAGAEIERLRDRAALDAYAKAADGPEPFARTLAQRRADVLVDMARRHLTHLATIDTPATTIPNPTHTTLVVDHHVLAGTTTIAQTLRSRCELTGVGPIPPSTALRLTCDTIVSRIVTRGRSTILDAGRATRTVTDTQRRALTVRDGGCVHPTCDRPAHQCHAHHLTHWARGGPTNLNNLALVCHNHHHLLHEGGWNLTRTPHGTLRFHPPNPQQQRGSPAQPRAA